MFWKWYYSYTSVLRIDLLLSILKVEKVECVKAFIIFAKQTNTSCPLLVSGYECGRVFPAGVGQGSSSRDAANGLSSGLSQSTETRRRYGWLRMVFPGARLFRAPIWCTWGGGGTREAGSTVTESLVAPYRRRARGVLNLCARESKSRTERFLRENVISDHGLFFSYEGQTRSGERARFVGRFSGMPRTLGGWILTRAPALSAQGLHHHGSRYFNFHFFCMMRDLGSKLIGA